MMWRNGRTILLAAGLVGFCASSGWTDDIPNSFKTPAGLVELKRSAGPACGSDSYDTQCSIITIGGRKVASDWSASITRVFPDVRHPAIVTIETSNGGNCCPPAPSLIDVSRQRPSVFKGFSLDEKGLLVGKDVTFNMISGTDKMGDPLSSTFRYRLGSGKPPSKIASEVRVTKRRPGEPQYASDVVGDPALREPLVRIVGSDRYASFRVFFEVSGPTTLINNQYLVGSGQIPHSGDHVGLFVIDLRNKLAWAWTAENTFGAEATASRWGILTWQDKVPQQQADAWLRSFNVPTWKVKDQRLPEELVTRYLASRLEAKPEKPVSAAASGGKPVSLASPLTASLEKSGGTFTVPVTINDAIKLNFVVDSGAADVSIPADVVMTLVRTGTLQSGDFLQEQTYRLADGSTVPSRTFRIRSLKVGDKTVENVIGSIASVKGSLLLGQSFLSRFKSWSIDNEKHALVLQ